MTRDPRGWGAASAAVFVLSVSGHVLGGGAVPTGVALVLVGILALTLGALLSVAERPWRARTLAPILGVFQIAAHGILHEVAGTGPVPVHALVDPRHHHLSASVGGAHETMAAQFMHAMPAHDAAMHAMPLHAHGLSPLMVTTHVLLTVVLAWLLGPATAQVRALVRRAVVVLPRFELRRPQPLIPVMLAGLSLSTTGTCISRRGPPRFTCV